ncbi:cobalamin biosynthesis protein [Rhizobium grahamii]|uniref:Cobalamin biosynthesis protein n=1 Tax=Rhizobium grahamii TaxID=1120045 RepID=A0A5Q0CD39_9HYPH|nr:MULTISPECIES: cobalamin biosynthesis protein [Rhizobium]QFY62394.1 cobalamin biosynthesis protein [Rhizobium grahamii]QRM51418.1 cobalamin biosynthesis protein [Rhizobium sp. BG6]
MNKVEFDDRRSFVLGLGCERGASPAEVLALARSALQQAGITADDIAAVASIAARTGEPAILNAAQSLAVPVIFFEPDVLERETPRLANPSDIVFKLVGCHGVAESAALAAAGVTAALILPKMKSPHATAAIAKTVLQND